MVPGPRRCDSLIAAPAHPGSPIALALNRWTLACVCLPSGFKDTMATATTDPAANPTFTAAFALSCIAATFFIVHPLMFGLTHRP